MRNYIKSLILILCVGFVSCESIVDGINDSPNKLDPETLEGRLFLTGALLANTVAQGGHLNRISAMYSGQLIGFTSLYSNIYGYSLSSAESIGAWSRIYVGTIPNVRKIVDVSNGDNLLSGIAKVVEAHAIGTAASLFGDVPYSQAVNPDIPDPAFDDQVSVLNAAIGLLDQGIADLNNSTSRSVTEDIHFGGNKDKWLGVANTLKARYYMHLKDYANAYAAAQNGISSSDGTMSYIPRGDANRAEGDKNLFWTILEGSRTGDIGTGDSYLMQLLDSGSGVYRGNAKTDETARFGYYTVDESGGAANDGIIEQFEPQPLVSFGENTLILAEAGARTAGFDTGLGHLNEHRAYLRAGGRLNASYIGETFMYEDYVAADFENGGMENADGIDATRALLREIVEERYVEGFGMYMPFDDARRLRKDDADLSVPFPLNVASATAHPERLPYSADEVNTNANAPAEPGIFAKTAVNQ